MRAKPIGDIGRQVEEGCSTQRGDEASLPESFSRLKKCHTLCRGWEHEQLRQKGLKCNPSCSCASDYNFVESWILIFALLPVMSSLFTVCLLIMVWLFSVRCLAQLSWRQSVPPAKLALWSQAISNYTMAGCARGNRAWGHAWACTLEQANSQTAASESSPTPSPFQWGS